MGNILKIKRGSGIVTSIFHEGEPIYNTSSKVLYLGDSGAGNGGILGTGSSIASEDTYLASKEILGIAGTDTAGYIQLKEGSDNGNNYIQIESPSSLASNYVLTLPSDDGDVDQVLRTDGSGNLSWVTQTGSEGSQGTQGTQGATGAGTQGATGIQ